MLRNLANSIKFRVSSHRIISNLEFRCDKILSLRNSFLLFFALGICELAHVAHGLVARDRRDRVIGRAIDHFV